MRQQRTPQPSPGSRGEAVDRSGVPATWIALAVAFLAVSVSPWIEALSGEGTLGFHPAVAFTLAAVVFALHAHRCARRRDGGRPESRRVPPHRLPVHRARRASSADASSTDARTRVGESV